MKKRSNTMPPDGEDFDKEFLEAIEAFYLDCRARNLTEKSIKYYRDSIVLLKRMMDYFGIKGFQIEPKHIQEFITMRLENVTDKTVNANIRGWRSFFNFCTRVERIKINPMKDIYPVKEGERIVETFSKAQIKMLLSVPNINTFTGFRDYVIMNLLLETGIRIGEAMNIKVDDINFKEGLIKVYGKTRKERLVPFQKTMEQLLLKYIKHRGKLETKYLFVSEYNLPLKQRTIQEKIREYGITSRIKGVRVSPHTFRHTFAKMYIIHGGDAFSLQKILGHTSLEMVQRYVAIFGNDISDIHRKYSPLERLDEDDED